MGLANYSVCQFLREYRIIHTHGNMINTTAKARFLLIIHIDLEKQPFSCNQNAALEPFVWFSWKTHLSKAVEAKELSPLTRFIPAKLLLITSKSSPNPARNTPASSFARAYTPSTYKTHSALSNHVCEAYLSETHWKLGFLLFSRVAFFFLS